MRMIWAVLYLVAALAMIVIVATNARATGTEHGVASSAIAGAAASVGPVSAGASVGPVSAGGASSSVSTRAFGGGSTGLTGTARCLGSRSFLFNLVSVTVRETGCVLEVTAAEHCKTDECRLALRCMDPDLPAAAKTVIGCPPPKD